MVKRWEPESYSDEFNPIHAMTGCHDGTYYILGYISGGTLYIKYAADQDSIKTSGTTAYSNASIAERATDSRHHFAMRLENGRLHLAFFQDEGANINTLYYTSPFNDE